MTNQNNAAQAAMQPILTAEERRQLLIRANYPHLQEEPRRYLVKITEELVLSKLRAEGVQAGDERAAFEAAWRELNSPWPMNSRMHDDGRYATPDIEREWRLWQARAALASAPVAGERVAQEYGSPADVAQRIEQYLAQDGRMNSGTQLLYEAMKALRASQGDRNDG